MLHTHSLTSLATLIAAVAMAIALIALQPQPRAAHAPAPQAAPARGPAEALDAVDAPSLPPCAEPAAAPAHLQRSMVAAHCDAGALATQAALCAVIGSRS